MNSYRYTLQPYTGPASRYICPQCTDKRKTFVRYIDTQTGQHLADHVGRCGRQDNCGYHFPPKQFFENHETPINVYKKRIKSPVQPQEVSLIKDQHWKSSLANYTENNLVLHLGKLWGSNIALQLAQRYRIGTSKLWKGATVFWQLTQSGSCRAGKIMLYNPDTGKRVKEPFNHVCWVHALKDENKQPLYPDYKLKQCLFGEHLLNNRMIDVALVESEKTAIIASQLHPDKIWLATGGKENLTAERCAAIRNKRIWLYPDAGAEDKWDAIAKDIFPRYELCPLLGVEKGMDVADVWVR